MSYLNIPTRGLLEANLCRFFIVSLYMYCSWRSNYQEGRVGISLTVSSSVVPAGFKFLFIKKGGLGILSYFCVCPKPGLQHVVMFFFVLNDFRWVVIVHFVYIDGIIYHNCLKFLLIISTTMSCIILWFAVTTMLNFHPSPIQNTKCMWRNLMYIVNK